MTPADIDDIPKQNPCAQGQFCLLQASPQPADAVWMQCVSGCGQGAPKQAAPPPPNVNAYAPANPQDISLRVLIPAFMISELKRAFEIGFLLFLPFLIIDLVVASVLMSMGMMMMSPVMVAMPFKLMLFVLVDGWHLVIGSLVQSFGP